MGYYEKAAAATGKRVTSVGNQVDIIDPYAGGMVVEQEVEREINEGTNFLHSDVDRDIDNVSPKYWAITSDTKDWFFSFRTHADNIGELELFENPTISDYGTRVICKNTNRVLSTGSSDLKLFKDPTVSDDGDSLVLYLIGSGTGPRSTGGSLESYKTLVLNTSDYDYILKFTPDNDGTRVVLSDSFHEYKLR